MVDFKLKDTFPRIYAVARNKERVKKAYEAVGGGWAWNVLIKRNLQDWELEEYVNLLLCLSSFKLVEHKDKRVWKIDKKRGFSVKSFYDFLTMRENNDSVTAPLQQIWKSKALPRIVFFAWEAAKEHILTIDKLRRKGNVLINRCYFCKSDEETCFHLLLGCPVTYGIWSSVLRLMGVD